MHTGKNLKGKHKHGENGFERPYCAVCSESSQELNAQWVWKVPDGCAAKKAPPVEPWQMRNGSLRDKERQDIWYCVSVARGGVSISATVGTP